MEEKDPTRQPVAEWLKSVLGKLKQNLHLAIIISLTSLFATITVAIWNNYKMDLRHERAREVQEVQRDRDRLERIFESGKRSGRNLEEKGKYDEAVKAFQQAQRDVTRAAMPESWATLQRLQGSALVNHALASKGPMRVRLLDEAVKALEDALVVHTPHTFPEGWADTQQWLGRAWVVQAEAGSGSSREALLDQAVHALRNAAQTYTDYSRDWANAQSWLGRAWVNQAQASQGQARENLLGQAVQALRQAAETYTDRSADWAATQSWLGRAWVNQAEAGEPTDGNNLPVRAERALTRALEVYTRDEFPQDWATVQFWLGRALLQQAGAVNDLAAEERARLLGQAEQSFRKALDIRTRRDWPDQHAEIQERLTEILRLLGEGEGT